MSIPGVSIIIPFVHETEYLREAVASAQHQHLVTAEIILVCNTAQEVAPPLEFLRDVPGIKILFEPVSGSAHARNRGLRAASAEWIQFLDVDDLLLPEKISQQAKHKQADIVVSPFYFQKISGHRSHSKWLPQDHWTGLLNSGLGSTSSMLWKRDALLSVNGWNTEYQSHQEYELLFRLLSSGKMLITDPAMQTIVRQRKAGSITLMSKPFRSREGIKLRTAIRDYLHQHEMLTADREYAFLQYVFRQLRGLYRQDKAEALSLYTQFFSHVEFKPEETDIPAYNVMYNALGFAHTERILSAYSRWRDKYFPFLPVNR